MKRPTIGDIARRAGLSKAAVSYALNGRPGVSEETRDRVSRIAHALGWRANTAALALSGARVGVVGLVVEGPVRWEIVAGIERELAGDGVTLQVAIASGPDAEETYQDWWASGRVDGVLVVDPRPDDYRIPLLRKLNIPTALLGASHPEMSSLCHDAAPGCRQLLEHLAGHRVGLIGHLEHLEKIVGTTAIHGDELQATRQLANVTAVIYDSPQAAAKVVAHAAILGLRIPAELAVVAWGDAPVCQLVHPEVTAVRHDDAADGATVARMLLDQLRTGTPGRGVSSADYLIVRGTT